MFRKFRPTKFTGEQHMGVRDKAVIESSIQAAIKKNVSELIRSIGHCSIGELYYFISGIHLRSLKKYNTFEVSRDEEFLFLTLMDTYRYLISMIAKEGMFDLTDISLNMSLIEELVGTARIINSKNETIVNTFLFSDANVEMDMESNLMAYDLREIESNPLVKRISDYGIRIQADVEDDNELKGYADVMASFQNMYSSYDDIFLENYGITITEFRHFVDLLIDTTQKRLYEINSFSLDEDDIIDINDPRNYLKYIKVITFSRDELLSFDSRIMKAIDLFTFKPKYFDPLQLRYDMLSVKPIVEIGPHFIINIELFLGALRDNVHYTFLGQDRFARGKYTNSKSKLFVQKVISVAERYNYTVMDTDLMLYEGKDRIGDLDIILKRDSKILYIEAKDHSLDLGVQAHDPRAIKARLQQQQADMELKVNRRLKKVTEQFPGTSFKYIIVTRKPEPLSHFGDLLVLSLKEFEVWLQLGEPTEFKDVFSHMYPFQKLRPETIRELSPISTPLR